MSSPNAHPAGCVKVREPFQIEVETAKGKSARTLQSAKGSDGVVSSPGKGFGASWKSDG